MTNQQLVIAIVNWNSYRLVLDAIDSINRFNPYLNFRCVVVDNNSRNIDCRESLLKLIGEENLIENKTNLGFGRANNQVIELCPGADVLILNPDTIQVSDAITCAWDILRKDEKLGVIGIRHIDHATGRTQYSAFHFGSPWFQVLNILRLGKYLAKKINIDHNLEQDVDWVVGSFMLVKKEVIQDTGGFDPEIFLNNEDIEWCLRIKKKGWIIRYIPGLTMRHIGGGTRHYMRDSNFSFVRSHLGFLWKTKNFFPFFAYYVLQLCMAIKNLLINLAMFLVFRNKKADVGISFCRFYSILLLRPVESGS